MSYNVDSWKTKELSGLRIPIASLYKHERSDWHPEREELPDGSTVLRVMDSQLVGTVAGDVLTVTRIQCSGEGSGTALNWIIEPALADSKGTLVAVRVWEGGDSIDRLTVRDGVVESIPVEL